MAPAVTVTCDSGICLVLSLPKSSLPIRLSHSGGRQKKRFDIDLESKNQSGRKRSKTPGTVSRQRSGYYNNSPVKNSQRAGRKLEINDSGIDLSHDQHFKTGVKKNVSSKRKNKPKLAVKDTNTNVLNTQGQLNKQKAPLEKKPKPKSKTSTLSNAVSHENECVKGDVGDEDVVALDYNTGAKIDDAGPDLHTVLAAFGLIPLPDKISVHFDDNEVEDIQAIDIEQKERALMSLLHKGDDSRTMDIFPPPFDWEEHRSTELLAFLEHSALVPLPNKIPVQFDDIEVEDIQSINIEQEEMALLSLLHEGVISRIEDIFPPPFDWEEDPDYECHDFQEYLNASYNTVDWECDNFQYYLSESDNTKDWECNNFQYYLTESDGAVDWECNDFEKYLSPSDNTIDWECDNFETYLIPSDCADAPDTRTCDKDLKVQDDFKRKAKELAAILNEKKIMHLEEYLILVTQELEITKQRLFLREAELSCKDKEIITYRHYLDDMKQMQVDTAEALLGKEETLKIGGEYVQRVYNQRSARDVDKTTEKSMDKIQTEIDKVAALLAQTEQRFLRHKMDKSEGSLSHSQNHSDISVAPHYISVV